MSDISFRFYRADDREACLALFDENCPAFFAANERADYAEFLDTQPSEYQVCLKADVIIGAFGLMGSAADWRDLNWILISPHSQGLGLGTQFIRRVVQQAKSAGLTGITIATSHLAEPFFAKHGASRIREIEHGWGKGMHRVDMELKL